MSAYLRELEMPFDQTPTMFRCRGRVGRGGRIVMDRIPVYGHQSSSTMQQCFFPTQLPSLPSQLAHQRMAELLSHSASTDQMVLSLRPSASDASTMHTLHDLSYDQLDEVSCLYSSLSSLPSYPLFYPPERTAMSSLPTPEERDIYTASDSEDELLEISHTGISILPSRSHRPQELCTLPPARSWIPRRSDTPSSMCSAGALL